jgi:hypothetical protein
MFFEAAQPLASGQDFHGDFVQRFTVEDGTFTEFEMFEDTLGLARAYLGQPGRIF